MTTIQITSLISPPAKVSIDPYGRNPLAEDCRQASKPAYDIAVRNPGPPPKLFTNGTADLPAFTASGIDPRLLLKLPYTARHYAASEPDPAQIHAFFEQYADDPYAHVAHEGLHLAVRRVYDWASGKMARKPADDPKLSDLFNVDALFGQASR